MPCIYCPDSFFGIFMGLELGKIIPFNDWDVQFLRPFLSTYVY
jgi:hypothetical protein